MSETTKYFRIDDPAAWKDAIGFFPNKCVVFKQEPERFLACVRTDKGDPSWLEISLGDVTPYGCCIDTIGRLFYISKARENYSLYGVNGRGYAERNGTYELERYRFYPVDRADVPRNLKIAALRAAYATARAPAPTPRTYRFPISLYNYVDKREAFKRFGELVSHLEQGGDTLDVLREAVEIVDDHNYVGGLIKAWNYHVPEAEHALHPCDCCGRYVAKCDLYDAAGDERVCDICLDEHYVCPEDDPHTHHHVDRLYYHSSCDGWYTYEEEEEEEEERNGHYLLHDYSEDVLDHYGPDRSIKSSKWGDFLMGIELEVCSGNRDAALEHTHDTLADGYAIMCEDGSLEDGEGFEIITAPRGLKEHIQRFSRWEPHHSLVAWDAPGACCGMHVHIDRKAFGDLTLGKLIEFICADRNEGLVKRIAGRHWRTSRQAERYCDGDKVVIGNPVKTLKGKCSSRFHAVNTQPENTIELRIFRASLNKKRLLAQIEFAHAAVFFCRQASMGELTEAVFRAWLADGAGQIYRHLAAWLGIPIRGKKRTPQSPAQALAA